MRLLIGAAAVFVLVAGCAKSVDGTALPVADAGSVVPGASKPRLPGSGSRLPLPSGTRSSSTAASSAPSSGAGSPVSVQDLQGHWEGHYTCGQGDTGLKLDIATPDATGTAGVTFTFFPLAANPNAASGSYAMTLTSTAGQLKFTQDHWIQQPSGYTMVDLLVASQSGTDSISGKVMDPGCTTFTVART